MKINLLDAPEKILKPHTTVEVGNVYKNQKGYIYIIAHITRRDNHFDGDKAAAFVVDLDGEITNVVHYSTYYFSRFNILGRAINLPEEIEIDWISK